MSAYSGIHGNSGSIVKIKVYRYHDGTAAALRQDNTSEDGTYQPDEANGLIHIFANKFSTYTVSYTASYTIVFNAGEGAAQAGPEQEPEPLPQDAAPAGPPPNEVQNTPPTEEPPAKRFLSFAENVADLKDPNKDCICTPDAFLAEISAYIRKFNHGIEWYTSPSYSAVFPELSQAQVKYLRELMDSVQAVLKGISSAVAVRRVGRCKLSACLFAAQN